MVDAGSAIPQAALLRRRRRLLVVVFALIGLLLLGAGLYLGQRAAYTGLGIDVDEYRGLKKSLPAAEAEITRLAGELEVSRTRHSVDRDALEMVRREIAEQKEQIAGLEEGLQFYRSLMAPESIAQGLSLRPMELVSQGEGLYAYRIVAQQEARKHSILRGELYVEIFGRQEGEIVTYPLASLADDLDNNSHKLRFRYFQSIEGELALPPGFEPTAVIVVARSESPSKTEIREEFPWQTNERFTHVGK
ncbi:MAG: DUF6776 family protein [Pseudomonadota bacterium]